MYLTKKLAPYQKKCSKPLVLLALEGCQQTGTLLAPCLALYLKKTLQTVENTRFSSWCQSATFSGTFSGTLFGTLTL